MAKIPKRTYPFPLSLLHTGPVGAVATLKVHNPRSNPCVIRGVRSWTERNGLLRNVLKSYCIKYMNLMIDDCFPKLEYEYIAYFGIIGMLEQNLVVILPRMFDACNDNWHIIKSKRN